MGSSFTSTKPKGITKMLLLNLLLPVAATAALSAASRSAPFHLSIRSDNETLNEKAVSACHQGALITSLCITDQSVNLTEPGEFALNVVPHEFLVGCIHKYRHGIFPTTRCRRRY